MRVLGFLNHPLHVCHSGAMLLFVLLLLPLTTVLSQGTEGFFNGSYVIINSVFDARARTSLSFKTCSAGQLLHQEGPTGDFITLTLLPKGVLEFTWQTNRQRHSFELGNNLINNHWHDVDIIHKLGSVTLSVSKSSVVVANSTPVSDIFEINLGIVNPQLIVGQGFKGCILQGAGVVLNDSNVIPFGVNWGKCPLPNKGDCDGYLMDHCFSQPCHKHSACVSLPDGYRCDCTKRYTGPNCEIDLGSLCNRPEYNKCQNGGACQEDKTGNITICACPPTFTGAHCETQVDNTFCDFMPCRNGGTCNINQFHNNYVCICPQGFAGTDCELNVDECQSSPCQNNGTCTDEVNAYTCDCSGTGYRGPNCEENINECEELNPCYTGSRCFDRYGDYICDCPPGFGGKNCDQEVNECDSNPCQNMGTCSDNLNGHLCHCVPGFAGINCEENIDDCNGVVCPANSHCVDGIGSFSCVCNPGFSGAVPHCSEIDECAEGPCLNNGTCQDHLNGFSCICADGFVGRHCEVNIDECETKPCQNGAVCIDGAGEYTCECVTGYNGTNCEIDINDCDPNPCKNGANCTDLVNDFFCECLPGWEGKTCVDNVNECLSQPCMHGQCLDLLNNFTCNCDPGFMGSICHININECDSSPCFNGGTCTDLINDYSCKCPEDFMGKNCLEVYDACKSGPCMNAGTCQTYIPSHEYTCICPVGYLGNQCEIDIDDCEGIKCPNGKVCVDLQNSYDCRCPIGFSGDNCSMNIDECSSNPCVNGTCIDGIGAYACDCPSGLTGKHCESDIDECQYSPCAHGICQNQPGHYLCFCTPGYTGIHCDIEFNECFSMPCKNNATCNDLVNNYSCTCLPGFNGQNCENDINECASDPCVHGATCHDLINKYECSCIEGFSGINCEVNIDECASNPCLNYGVCIDLINAFTCNCSDTGFSGMLCETNIDDCALNPCQNGAWCEDLIKDYRCHCYGGYNGKNCEIDIEECASSPCFNNALCLENSNQTLYDMNYLGLFPAFSYAIADGYRCICSSGFTGANCETNIDDCAHNLCKKGICIDGINDYYCACHLGYDGQYCGREIDECMMLDPCENNATCIDLIADFRCECLPGYGGKSCQTKLLGCQNIVCENGATCIPSLDDSGRHNFTCACEPGYYGHWCETATTFSLNSTDSVSVTHYNDLPDKFSLKFSFRTTLGNGLISFGQVSSTMLTYFLYLWNGLIKVDIYNDTSRILELFSKNGQNDSFWKIVELEFEPNKVSLNVSGWNVPSKPMDFSSLNFTVSFGNIQHLPHSFIRNDINNISGFIGCIQDISMNGDVIIPVQNSVLHGAIKGCYRKEQCEGSPCHNGFCKDNWLSYECICSRPYFGTACEYNYEAATFGYRDEKSHAELLIPEHQQAALTYDVDISLFLRTRNESGIIFYMGSSLNGSSNCHKEQNVSFLLARLVMGKIQVILTLESGDVKELNHWKKVDDGDTYFVQITKSTKSVHLKVNDSLVSSSLSPSSSICQEVVYIAGLPGKDRQKREVYSEPLTNNSDVLFLEEFASFKGIIHDFRINNKEVVFYELNGEGEGFPEIFATATLSDAVKKGVVSDEPCNILQPCLHDSMCVDIWNEYVCVCPEDYRGKNCQEKKPCADNACPSDSECRNLDVGYECVASASFDGKNSRIQYQVQDIGHNITNITFTFRSKSSGTILWLESQHKSVSNHFLHIEMVSGRLEVKWDLGPSYDNLPLHKTVSKKFENVTGDWHEVEIWFDDNLVHLKVSGYPENLSEDNYTVGLSELLNEGADIYLGYRPGTSDNSYKGCLKDVRIGGYLLSFVNSSILFNPNNKFVMLQQKVLIGCTLCWDEDCEHGKCDNYTESYDCKCIGGYEGQKCDIDMCDSQRPCFNNGTCYHGLEGSLMCNCPKEYAGPKCSEKNYCEPMPCDNGGTCITGSGSYQCLCSEYFMGINCSQWKIRDCSNVNCYHGTCRDIDVPEKNKFKCICHDGYEGTYCKDTKDFCSNSPCKNGGICSIYEGPDYATYTCDCPEGFSGDHCELNINECLTKPCIYGNCIDKIGKYECECYPGYKDDNCSSNIQSCYEDNACYNGRCIPDASNQSYKCECKPGYIGRYCSIYDECDKAKCNYQGECEPSFDEYETVFIHKCTCKDGFGGNDCTQKVAISGSDDDTNLILIILIPVLSLFLLCILIGSIIFLRVAKKKRATRGTYSPSRQEMFGSRVEMNHVMKPPPEERLI